VKGYESSEKGEMVMRKTLRIFALLIAASMLLWIAGCGGDDDDDDDACDDNKAPTVTLSPNGGDIGSNTIISATFNKAVDTVTATGATPTVSADKKVWTFTLSVGDGQAVTVEGTDACGDTGSASATFSVGAPDTVAPEIDGAACDPKDGASGVDPSGISEIIIKFSETLSSAELQSFEPEISHDPVLDGDTMTISFLGGASLSNEQEIEIDIDIEDSAGNAASVTYGFTTMSKEE
jgi:hypothetical protein